MNKEKYFKLLVQEKQRILRNLFMEKRVDEKTESAWVEPKDLEEWADLKIQDDMRCKLCERELSILKSIDVALKKIKEGKYGICEKCGKEIEEERLDLIPWTRYCSICSRNAVRGK